MSRFLLLGQSLIFPDGLVKRHTYTHEELVRGLRGRDEKALAYLYDNYSRALYGVIYVVVRNKEEAEDVLQKAFLKIWNNFESYDIQKGRLYTWMLNIARNLAIDSTRSKHEKLRQRINTDADTEILLAAQPTIPEPTHEYLGLNNILLQLKEEHQRIIDLAYFEGYTQEEISQKLSMPLGTVKTKVRQAIIKLRELMAGEHML